MIDRSRIDLSPNRVRAVIQSAGHPPGHPLIAQLTLELQQYAQEQRWQEKADLFVAARHQAIRKNDAIRATPKSVTETKPAANPGWQVYASGYCKSGNIAVPQTGGWHAIIVDPDGQQQETGGKEPLTNVNRMELQAAIAGLRQTPETRLPVTVITLSHYLANACLKKWLDGWILNNFLNTKKEKVRNHDLWEKMAPLYRSRQPDFTLLKNPNEHPLIRKASAIARKQAQSEKR